TNSVPGSTQTAMVAASDAANPRVPVPKSRVVSLSPTFAGRDLMLWRLKSHIWELSYWESPSASSILSSFSFERISGVPRETLQRSIHYGDNNLRASNCRHCSPCLSNPVCARERYVVMPTFVQPLDRNREVVSMNFCPLDISRRASSARAPISSFSHS